MTANDSSPARRVPRELDGRRLDDVQIAIQLTSLLVGGTETMPKIVAGGVRELAAAPEQRAALAADPGHAAAREMLGAIQEARGDDAGATPEQATHNTLIIHS